MDAVYVNGGEVAASNGMAQAQHVLNWNPKQLDIKTKSVEKTLEPLVLQVGTISLLFPPPTQKPISLILSGPQSPQSTQSILRPQVHKPF